MIIVQTIFLIISLVMAFFLLLPFLSVLLSFLNKEKIKDIKEGEAGYRAYDYGCIITAYKNVEITRPLVESLIRQNYNHHHIYLVADECDISGFDMAHEKLTVLRPDPPMRLKAKSIIHAIEQFVRPHEYIVIFDADNLAHPDFLKEINKYALNGCQTIQGQRTAKNLDTVYACADSTGEFYKNYIDRYIPYLIGSSSVISGSGMAVESELYKAYLNGPDIQAGKDKWKKMLQEDKILQNDLLKKNEKISYAWDAIVYDEKVTTGEQVETQRSRWLFSYFQNLPNSSGLLWKGLTNFSFNQLYFGLVTIAPPLFITLFAAFFLAVIGFWLQPELSYLLAGSLIIFVLNIFLVLYLSKVPKKIWEAIWAMPLFVWNQVTALLKMGNPDKNFKHTEHNRTFTIDEVLKTPNEKSTRP